MSQYLKDPEEPLTTWSEPIRAHHDEEAQNKCYDLARQYNVELDRVERVSINCYYCYFCS
jgi:hypothetical protein